MRFKRVLFIFVTLIIMLLFLTPAAYANSAAPGGYSGLGVIIVLLAIVVPLVITLVMETLIAYILRFRKYPAVLLVNLISNVLMNISLIVFALSFAGAFKDAETAYLIGVIICEMVFTAAEFLVYFRLYKKEYGFKKIFIFALTANVVSCLAGFAYSLMVLY